jgi:hypothetical protein
VWDLAACPVSLHAKSSASAAVEIVETRPVLLTRDLATRIAFCEDFACPVERIVRAVAPSRDQPHQLPATATQRIGQIGHHGCPQSSCANSGSAAIAVMVFHSFSRQV